MYDTLTDEQLVLLMQLVLPRGDTSPEVRVRVVREYLRRTEKRCGYNDHAPREIEKMFLTCYRPSRRLKMYAMIDSMVATLRARDVYRCTVCAYTCRTLELKVQHTYYTRHTMRET